MYTLAYSLIGKILLNLDQTIGSITSFDGVESLILKDSNTFKMWDADTDSTKLIASTISNPSAQTVVFYRTVSLNSVVGVYSSDRKTASFYLITQ